MVDMLPAEILAHLWPKERLLVGLRVCKAMSSILKPATLTYYLEGYMRGGTCRYAAAPPRQTFYLAMPCFTRVDKQLVL